MQEHAVGIRGHAKARCRSDRTPEQLLQAGAQIVLTQVVQTGAHVPDRNDDAQAGDELSERAFLERRNADRLALALADQIDGASDLRRDADRAGQRVVK